MIMVKKKYSVAHLLSKQPKALRKIKGYALLMRYYRSSDLLFRIRFTRTCYCLLNQAKIDNGRLDYFYRRFILPRHPFFPLFLKIKREYLNGKDARKKEKAAYIAGKIKLLPQHVVDYLKYCARFERHYNSDNAYPAWKKLIYPKTKKRVNALMKFDLEQWVDLFLCFFDSLKVKYQGINERSVDELVALFILELPYRQYSNEVINTQYRQLSKKYHPDAGGSTRAFNYLQFARETLLDR